MVRRTIQRTQLAADGRKAIQMIARGFDVADILAVIGGSRARLYRAMAVAAQHSVDPLLL